MTAFVVGATGAGAALGAVLGAAGSPLGSGAHWRVAALALAALIAVALDLGSFRVPGPNRQVNERWLDEYRGWVYGLGFGSQLGLGVTTIVSSTVTYVALLAALLAGDPVGGAIIFGIFGLTRGLLLLAGAGVSRPEELVKLHRRLARGRRPAWIAGRALVAVVTIVAIGSVL